MSSIQHLAPLGILAGTCLLVYGRTLDVPFVFDDFVNILEMRSVRWTELSVENLVAAATRSVNRRPVANVSFALNHLVGREAVAGYHAVNLAVHVANGLLVYWLALRLLRREASRGALPPAAAGIGLACFAALLFACHPIQTQSVTYVVQRMTSLAAFFYLAALLLYARGREATSRRGAALAHTGAGLAWLLALGSKEIAVTWPVAAWLYEWFFVRDLDRRFARASLLWLGLPLGVAAAALYYVHFQGPAWGFVRREFNMGERLLTELRVVVFYLSQVLYPHPDRLSLQHEFALSRSLLSPPTTLACAALLASLLALAGALARRERLASFAILWFFLHLALESSILPLELAHEHRLYLPMVGAALLAARLLLAAWSRAPRAAGAAAVALCVALGTATAARNEVWRDRVTLWSHSLTLYPDSARAHTNLGASLSSAGEPERAMAHFAEAVRLAPDLVDGYLNLGASWLRYEEPGLALAALREAERLDPDHPRAQAGLGDALAALGRDAEAVPYYQASLQLRADPRVLNSLGAVRSREGRFDEALLYFAWALELDPVQSEALVNSGAALSELGRHEEAVAVLARAAAEFATADAHAQLSSALLALGRKRAALAHLREARHLDPDSLEIANNLAWILATSSDRRVRSPAEAVRVVEELLRRLERPGAGLLDTAAVAYAADGRFADAIAHAERALELASAEPELAAEIREHLARFRAGQAVREGAATRADPAPAPGEGG